MKDTQEKRKEAWGIFVQITFLVLLKQELLKFDSCTIQNLKSAIYPYFLYIYMGQDL